MDIQEMKPLLFFLACSLMFLMPLALYGEGPYSVQPHTVIDMCTDLVDTICGDHQEYEVLKDSEDIVESYRNQDTAEDFAVAMNEANEYRIAHINLQQQVDLLEDRISSLNDEVWLLKGRAEVEKMKGCKDSK